MSADEETRDEKEETKLISAEMVTVLAKSFLQRLGNKQGLKPIKASLEGNVYVVEVELFKKIATVHVDATTEQIKEYEIKDKEQETPQESLFPIPLTLKNILFMAGISAASVVVSALLGIQSLISGIL
ncbi:MAG: hypothetical protein PVH73_05650 [Candidatus Bathyarchaeota archaeon]|jgi:hypothetical protein